MLSHGDLNLTRLEAYIGEPGGEYFLILICNFDKILFWVTSVQTIVRTQVLYPLSTWEYLGVLIPKLLETGEAPGQLPKYAFQQSKVSPELNPFSAVRAQSASDQQSDMPSCIQIGQTYFFAITAQKTQGNSFSELRLGS